MYRYVYIYIYKAGITRSESQEASGLSTTQRREVCSYICVYRPIDR